MAVSTNRSGKKLKVTGIVQGVGFRPFVYRLARAHHLAGWVRNRRDGSVEALFFGEKAMVEAMIEACRRGPPSARVTSVVTEPAEVPDQQGFHQLPTV